ncbi:MAG: LacI family DNA-binding transcriptional regulator, partial [Dehalococcoidia bacterium]
MATIYDVARHAEVSIGTVSRVLNGHKSVRPVTRRAVLAAIEELGYHPNALARGLLSARTETIGMLVPNLGTLVVQLIEGAERVALAHDYTLLIGNAHADEVVEERYLRKLLERRVDGLLWRSVGTADTLRATIQAAGVPTVLLFRRQPDPVLPSAIVDEDAAINAAVEDLASLGHRRIGMIADATEHVGGPYRMRVVRRALERLGLPVVPELMASVDTRAAVAEAAGRMLAQIHPPTALILNTLNLAAVGLQTLHQRGVRMPDDVSVVAFGDSIWAVAHDPPLSVVTVDVIAHAQDAME